MGTPWLVPVGGGMTHLSRHDRSASGMCGSKSKVG